MSSYLLDIATTGGGQGVVVLVPLVGGGSCWQGAEKAAYYWAIARRTGHGSQLIEVQDCLLYLYHCNKSHNRLCQVHHGSPRGCQHPVALHTHQAAPRRSPRPPGAGGDGHAHLPHPATAQRPTPPTLPKTLAGFCRGTFTGDRSGNMPTAQPPMPHCQPSHPPHHSAGILLCHWTAQKAILGTPAASRPDTKGQGDKNHGGPSVGQQWPIEGVAPERGHPRQLATVGQTRPTPHRKRE